MKKKYIYGIVAVSASLMSCNDFLDKEPLDRFTDSPAYWSNRDNVENQCNKLYQNYSGYGNRGGGGWYYFKSLSDDQASGTFTDWANVNVPAASENWKLPFTEIRRIGYILRGLRISSLDEATKKYYEGVARLNRAWQYYQLVRMYGDVQWIDEVIDPTKEEELYGERLDRDIVMDKVLEDLNFACENITGTNKAFWNKGLAYAMKADITLFEGTFCKYRTAAENGKAPDNARTQKYLQECVKACEEIMKMNYSLSKTYKEIYNSISLKENPEMIFIKAYALEVFMHSTIAYTGSSSNQSGITKDAFEAFLFKDGKPLATTSENKNDAGELMTVNADVDAQGKPLTARYISIRKLLDVRDARLEALLDPIVYFKNWGWQRGKGGATMTSSTGYGIGKFDNLGMSVNDRENVGRNYTDAPLFWLSVVYLNYAEAKAELGTIDQNDLDKTVNKLQARAGLPPMSLTPEADPANNMGVSNLLWEIRRCRRCELMIDNWVRYWDLIRWHQLDKLDSKKYPDILKGANIKAAIEYANANPSDTDKRIDISLVDGTYIDASADKTRIFEARQYLYPIPSGQLTLNKNLKQNKGWEK